MNKTVFFILVSAGLALAGAPRLRAQCYTFTHEHVDLLSVQFHAVSNSLSLMASDDDHGGAFYASNQCVVVCPESMKFALPAGTPMGNEGDPLWILPQNPYAGVPYVGVSAEPIAPGTFDDPLTIQLTRIEGPGHFLVWQTTGFGSFDLKMDTRDGIGSNDKLTPFVGAHEHHNWGFTTSGVYRVYFQASGRRPGQTTNIVSPETPFTFHILPLKPFEHWTATNWPCECDLTLIAPGADPDGDAGVNAIEYALGTDPKMAAGDAWPTVSLVTANGQAYGAMSYTRNKAATDCGYEVVAASSLFSTDWQTLTTVHETIHLGDTERITMRDTVPVGGGVQRFFRLRVRLAPPQPNTP
ncbi:MAG TPA: choice-of-anchor M domain-containing protein [Candidatus Paceibacterota bacterium]|nr:choice-of-anchor M domain-containing protein [Verrucomicrobiota bacterium]HRY51645.1 choice-of-anchor M domain-containing protein [Candidatus Paceibacterota bacterium]